MKISATLFIPRAVLRHADSAGLRRRREATLPTEKTDRLLAWIDDARAANWPVERNRLIALVLIGLGILLALRLGFLTP